MAGDHHGSIATFDPERLLVRCAWELRVSTAEHPLPEGWDEAMERLQLKSTKLEVLLGYALPMRPRPEPKSDAA
jgi:hypothetical protein